MRGGSRVPNNSRRGLQNALLISSSRLLARQFEHTSNTIPTSGRRCKAQALLGSGPSTRLENHTCLRVIPCQGSIAERQQLRQCMHPGCIRLETHRLTLRHPCSIIPVLADQRSAGSHISKTCCAKQSRPCTPRACRASTGRDAAVHTCALPAMQQPGPAAKDRGSCLNAP